MAGGKVPLSILTVSQKSAGGVAVVKVGLPVLGFTATDCALGSANEPD